MATLKATWPQFDGAESVEIAITADGDPAGEMSLPGTAIEQEFFAPGHPETVYEVLVRSVSQPVTATLQEVGGGSGGGGGGE